MNNILTVDDFYICKGTSADIEFAIDTMIKVSDGLLETLFTQINVHDALIMIADEYSEFLSSDYLYLVKQSSTHETLALLIAFQQHQHTLPDILHNVLTPDKLSLLEQVLFVAQPGEFYVNTLYVKEEYRKLGLASLLLDLVKMEATNAQCPSVCLHCYADNTPALKLYQSAGFIEQGRISYAPLSPSFAHQEGLIMRCNVQ